MKLPLLLALALLVSGCARMPNGSWREHSAAAVPRPTPHLMSDSLYTMLSATPIDSLSARQYQLLVEERRLRSSHQSGSNPVATGFLVTLGVIGALMVVSAITAGAR